MRTTAAAGILPSGRAREELRAKGQFWTPPWVAEMMVEYALGAGADRLFDPAVGRGAFFEAARRIAPGVKLSGFEIDMALEGKGVEHRDFLMDPPSGRHPAIVANPPYIRHHRVGGDVKSEMRAFARQFLNLDIDGRAGLQVYFFLRALERLTPGGRCAFILPADVAEGKFAPELWRAVSQHYCLERVVTFAPEATPFPGIDTNALVVMLSRKSPQPQVQWMRLLAPTRNGAAEVNERGLEEMVTTGLSRAPSDPSLDGPRLGEYARVMRGIATGDNEFFFLTLEQIRRNSLPLRNFVRAIGRTRDIQGATISDQDLAGLDAAGRPTYLLNLDGVAHGASVERYLERGDAAGLPRKALIATRRPWYRMEQRQVPPILFAYLGRRNARFIRNEAGVVPLTGFLCVYPYSGRLTQSLLRVLMDPRTVANLARVGKSYGDGAIKVEPRALERLPLPKAACIEAGLPAPAAQDFALES